MYIKIKNGWKKRLITKLTAVFMITAMLLLLTSAVLDKDLKHITLVSVDAFSDSEQLQEYTTRQDIVSDFLEENNISVGEYDKVSMLFEDELYDGARLVIRKGRKLTINIDGNVEIITTTKKTIRDAFEEAGVVLGTEDYTIPDIDSEISENLSVGVVRVEVQQITEDIEIPFKSTEVADSSLTKGTTRVKVNGVNGLKRVVYNIVTENGKEIGRKAISETVIKQPTNRVIAVGKKAKASAKTVKTTAKATKENKTTNGNKSMKAAAASKSTGHDFSYSKKITVTATAYTAAAGQKTASGRVAQVGVIAVDPNVIPIGTRLYVESTDDGKTWTYGYCVAGDTGGAIKGNKIDLFYGTKGECVSFGRRTANVYVLN